MLKLLTAASPEELFIKRYDVLMSWALALTNGDRAQAEDLVHDAFVQFTLRGGHLRVIENTDGYLNRMLRNMYLSQVRRATLIQDSSFSIANYDSAEIGLRSTEIRERRDVQDDLRQICEYACARKESSKAGCVLILRFFHGYYPSEIGLVLRATRKAVDRYLLISRRESKLYLSDPDGLHFTSGRRVKLRPQLGYVRSTNELLKELRQNIFDSRQGECLNLNAIKSLYRFSSTATIELSIASHLVTCASCLDEVNRLLGLPLLAERTIDEKLGRETPPRDSGDGDGASGGGAVQSHKQYERRLRETIEHRPQELRIAVNGFLLGSQQISSEFNNQLLSVNIDEPIGFVEIFSEQGLRLLFCDVEQPIDGSVEQTAKAKFDCGRTLDVSLSFRGLWPTLNVSYHDPTFEDVQRSSEEMVEAIPGRDSAAALCGTRKALIPFASLIASSRRFDWRILLRPGTVTAAFALILVVVALLTVFRPAPNRQLTAAEVLQRAASSENSIAANRDQVLHRILRLEEKSSNGQVLSSRRVEIWRSAEKRVTTRRLYDENDRLVAGSWTRSDGVKTIYHHGGRPELRRTGADFRLSFDTVWELEPSAKEFQSLIKSEASASVEETDNVYLIHASSSLSPGLARASLTLIRPDLHATSQTLVISQDGELREYTFSETSFERRAPSSVAPAVFELEPSLISETTSDDANRIKERSPETSPLAIDRSPVVALPALELEVLKELNQANALYGEQISLSRTSDGRLRIAGLVETDRRKLDILQSLAALKKNPALQIQIETVAEVVNRQLAGRSGSQNALADQSLEAELKNMMPAESELRSYLSSRGNTAGEELDREVRNFAGQQIEHARQARRHAVALKQIAERFSEDDLRSLDDSSRRQWRALIAQHALSAQNELIQLRHDLQSVFTMSDSADEIFYIKSDSDLAHMAKRLFDLTVSVDEDVGRSFSIYRAGGVAAVKTHSFWRSLSNAITLSQQLSRASELKQ